MKILVIDDSKLVYAVVKEICDTLKWETINAPDGQIGFEYLKSKEKYDLILLDWNMPNLDGIGFLKKCIGEYKILPVPVIMMTTENDPEKISLAISLGISEYIMKPFTADILEFKVKAVLESLGRTA